jgi:hypothetical protein
MTNTWTGFKSLQYFLQTTEMMNKFVQNKTGMQSISIMSCGYDIVTMSIVGLFLVTMMRIYKYIYIALNISKSLGIMRLWG